MAEILKGAPVAAALNEKTAALAAWLAQRGVTPTLAILRVGENPGDLSYERGVVKRCGEVGVAVEKCVLAADCSQSELMSALHKLNTDASVHGILVFRPLPAQLDEEAVRQALVPEKDVDGITDGSLAGVFTGSGTGFAPCTAQAVVEILDHYGIDCQGKSAVILGRSLVVGRPAAMLLLHKNATVTLCHSKSVDAAALARGADILVVSMGKAKCVGAEYLHPGQTVIDVGINMGPDGKLCGDVDFDAAEPTVDAMTPVPGGVGAVTTAVLLDHVVSAAASTLKRGYFQA